MFYAWFHCATASSYSKLFPTKLLVTLASACLFVISTIPILGRHYKLTYLANPRFHSTAWRFLCSEHQSVLIASILFLWDPSFPAILLSSYWQSRWFGLWFDLWFHWQHDWQVTTVWNYFGLNLGQKLISCFWLSLGSSLSQMTRMIWFHLLFQVRFLRTKLFSWAHR